MHVQTVASEEAETRMKRVTKRETESEEEGLRRRDK